MVAQPDGTILNLSTSLLEPSPFKDFLIPGIILASIVGGTNLLAVFFNMHRSIKRYNWALAGGIMISGWIIVQMILIRAVNMLQLIYLGIGAIIILVSFQLKGKWVV